MAGSLIHTLRKHLPKLIFYGDILCAVLGGFVHKDIIMFAYNYEMLAIVQHNDIVNGGIFCLKEKRTMLVVFSSARNVNKHFL